MTEQNILSQAKKGQGDDRLAAVLAQTENIGRRLAHISNQLEQRDAAQV
jgi:hypothetical protein